MIYEFYTKVKVRYSSFYTDSEEISDFLKYLNPFAQINMLNFLTFLVWSKIILPFYENCLFIFQPKE